MCLSNVISTVWTLGFSYLCGVYVCEWMTQATLQNLCAYEEGCLEQASELTTANVLRNRARRARSANDPIGPDSGRCFRARGLMAFDQTNPPNDVFLQRLRLNLCAVAPVFGAIHNQLACWS